MAKEYKTSEVFGISREIPLNYAYRESVDTEMVNSLTRDKHLVIYGSSKQGKTSLRKQHLQPSEYVVVTCLNTWTLPQLMSSILKQLGYTVEQSTTIATSGEAKITAKGGFKARWFGTGIDAEVGSEVTGGRTKEVTEVALELDPADVNDIITALERAKFKGWLVLEDFHYLPDETQKRFAVALKAFHESSKYTFIIVGVWLQENRLVQYNGDLTGRVTTINADRWTREELLDAISQGEELLNVEFEDSFRQTLVDESYDSIYVVQESCYQALEQNQVHATQRPKKIVAGDAKAIVRNVVNKQSARYMDFLIGFAQGFGSTDLQMYKWLLVPIIMTPVAEHEKGLELREIRRILGVYHPRGDDLNAGNVTQALRAFASLQVQHGMTPIVFDYDSAHRQLNVVDRSFLIWLNQQDKREVLETVDLPAEIADTWQEKVVQTR